MLLGAIADDFTGATDLANSLTRRGMPCVQLNGLPEPEETAKLFLLLRNERVRLRTEEQRAELAEAFPS